MGDWRKSNLKNYLVEGIPQMEATIRNMLDEDLSKAILSTLREIGTPTQAALIQHYNNAPAKHDGESTRKALQHRWWNKYDKKGRPVGYSRFRILKELIRSGYGIKVKRAKTRGEPYVLRIKVRENAVHLLESGRKKAQTIQRTKGPKAKYTTSNQYRGWMRGIEILKAFAARAAGDLSTMLPAKIERAAALAAKRSGVRA